MTPRDLWTLADRVQCASAWLVWQMRYGSEDAAVRQARIAGHYANQLISLAERGRRVA